MIRFCSRGRHIVAKCDLGVGKTILVEENFFHSVISEQPEYCETCFKGKTNLIACDSCPNVKFCDDECKNRNEIHKIDCNTAYFDEDYGRTKSLIESIIFVICLFANADEMIHFVEDVVSINC